MGRFNHAGHRQLIITDGQTSRCGKRIDRTQQCSLERRPDSAAAATQAPHPHRSHPAARSHPGSRSEPPPHRGRPPASSHARGETAPLVADPARSRDRPLTTAARYRQKTSRADRCAASAANCGLYPRVIRLLHSSPDGPLARAKDNGQQRPAPAAALPITLADARLAQRPDASRRLIERLTLGEHIKQQVGVEKQPHSSGLYRSQSASSSSASSARGSSCASVVAPSPSETWLAGPQARPVAAKVSEPMGGLRTDWSIASNPITNRDNIAETLVLRALATRLASSAID